MKQDLKLNTKGLDIYKFNKWKVPCNGYMSYLSLTCILGPYLLSEQTQKQDSVNCFYYRIEGSYLLIFVSLIDQRKKEVIQKINEIIKSKPTFESEFKPETDQEITIARILYITYNTLTIQSIAVASEVHKLLVKAEKGKLSDEDNLMFAKLQIIGVDIGEVTQRIFGVDDEKIMFRYADLLSRYLLNDIGKNLK